MERAFEVDGEILQRDVFGSLDQKRTHESVKHELRALAIDLKRVKADDRECDSLQTLIVIADEEIFFERIGGVKIVAAFGEDELLRFTSKRGAHGGRRIASIASAGAEGLDVNVRGGGRALK